MAPVAPPVAGTASKKKAPAALVAVNVVMVIDPAPPGNPVLHPCPDELV